MEYLILGPLEVTANGRTLELRAAKQQAVLATLLLHPNEVVSVPRLLEALWGASPPATAAKAVQGYVSELRKLLGAGAIATRARGYRLEVEPGAVDAVRFQRLADEGRAALEGDPARAAALFGEALALWRGDALEGLELGPAAQGEVELLSEQRLAVLEQRIEAELALGRHAELVAELRRLVAEHPFRERLSAHLMLALYRSGRQTEALAAYRDARTLLADELGLDPGAELRRLERQIFAQAPELDPPARPPAPSPDPPARRLVTVVAAGAVGPALERLDPESAHGVLDRYSSLCAEVLELHGGTVESFAGADAIGAFGLRELHEDDALRAVRAAAELREAVASLSGELEREHGVRLGVRSGIDSGELFAGSGARRDTFAAGPTIDVALRLAHAAAPGEILLGEGAHRLVEREIDAAAVDRDAPAWRLVELRAREAPATPFVDRHDELAALERALAEVDEARECRLATVLGSPGIGKTRLARELIARVGERTTVVVGRCPSYGAGITFAPLTEIVHQLGGPRIGELLAGEEPARRVVLATAGLADGECAAEETSWAFRRLFEALARERPLLAVFEDVHWAEPTLLALLESLAAFSSGSPILLVCLARPELLERRPGWAAPQPNRRLLALEPLPEANALDLVDRLVPEGLEPGTRARIVETAEGNPLFLEQLLAVQTGGAEPVLPPSVQAVLAARIERLEPGERTVLRYGSVEGRTFHRGALAELLPDEERPALDSRLVALVGKQLLRPERPQLAGEDAFRFTHVLIREAAYAGLPKQLRAGLHERVARRLESRPDAQEELIGYHLEQAYRSLAELGPPDEAARAVGMSAGEKLLASGLRAMRARGDLAAAANLLERANALLPADDRRRLEAQPALASALIGIGRLARADAVLADAVERARAAGDERSEAYALLQRTELRLHGAGARVEGVQAEIERLLGVFERLGNPRGVARCWLELGKLRAWLGSCEGAVEAIEQAFAVAESSGHSLRRHRVGIFLILAIAYGPAPVDDAVRRIDRVLRDIDAGTDAEAVALCCQAWLRSMQGRFDEARAAAATGRALLRERGLELFLSAVSMLSGPIELLAGDAAAAERDLRGGYDALERFGETTWRSMVGARLADAVRVQGRLDEALALTEECERLAARDYSLPQVDWRAARARTLAGLGRLDEAERVARECLPLVEPTDYLFHQATAYDALAEVLRAAGKADEAAAAAGEAVRRYEQKGATLLAARFTAA
jgi:DNA-binding SARP family transcriptional activator